ncbi:hypothetical protein [Fluviicola sp.]|uniref:hypothetical protein n=1 Tax=Fluviicola sp. TaxID=1917219 RepID=UPI003D2E1BAF
MKNYRPVAAILFTTLLLSCGNNQEDKQEVETPVETQALNEEPKPELKKEAKKPKEDTHVKITHTEDKLIDLVWQLPEVKNLSDKIERESKGKRHLVGRISSTPSDDQEYYGVSVAEDNGEALATYFEFRIYPDNTMYYYDVVEDQELTLKEWRTRKK